MVELSDEELEFHLQQTHDEISKFPRLAEMYHLESEVSNGKMTPIGLAERVLDVNLDFLEKYKEMDVSGGIKEQNDLLDLVGKVERITVDENLETTLGKGFDDLNSLEAENLVKNRMEVTAEMSKVVENLNTRAQSTFKFTVKMRQILDELSFHLEKITKLYRETMMMLRETIEYQKTETLCGWMMETVERIQKNVLDLHKQLEEAGYLKKIEGLAAVKKLIEFVTLVESNKVKMGELKGLVPKLETISTDLKTIKTFRDSSGFETFDQDLHQDLGSLAISEQYPNHPEISRLADSLKEMLLKVSRLSAKSEDFIKDLKSGKSKFPSGDLTGDLTSLKTCLGEIKTDIELSDIKSMIQSYESKMSNVDVTHSKFLEAVAIMMMPTDTDLEYIDMKNISFYLENSYYDNLENKIGKFRIIEHTTKWNKPIKDLLERDHSDPSDPEYSTKLEQLLFQEKKPFEDLVLAGKQPFVEQLNEKLPVVEQFITCYSKLKTGKPEIRTAVLKLIQVLKKSVELDTQEMESYVEVIDEFKGAYRMLTELKIETREGFPLDEEGVREISEGVWIHEEILNIQKTWNILKEVDIVGNLNEFMENFPNSLKDPLPSLDLTEYHGEQKMEILNFLEDVANFQKNSEENSEKLNKMNERIEEIKKWMDSDENEEKGWKDCFENSCDDVTKLPEVTPDAPIVEFKET